MVYSFSIYKYGFLIPSRNFNNIKEFANGIKNSEVEFNKEIQRII